MERERRETCGLVLGVVEGGRKGNAGWDRMEKEGGGRGGLGTHE